MSVTINEIYRRIQAFGVDIDYAVMIQYIGEALSAIKASPDLERVVGIYHVSNHKSHLPGDYISIHQIARMFGYDGKCFCDSASNFVVVTSYTNTITEVGKCGQPISMCKDVIMIKEIDDYKDIVPVRKARNSMFQLNKCCDENINIRSKFHEYYISDDEITYDFDKGIVLISYDRIPLDENGLPKVPDKYSYIQAVEKYILYRYYEREFIKTPSNENQRRYQSMQQNWYLYVKQAANESMMPTKDDIQNIYERNHNPFISDTYYKLFNNTQIPISKNTNIE